MIPHIRDQFSSIQSLSLSDSLKPHELQHARPPCPSPTPGVHPYPSIESVMPSNHLILCCPLLLLPSILPSIRVFSNKSALRIRWPQYWHLWPKYSKEYLKYSTSKSVLPMNTQDLSPLGWTGWISL